MSNYCACSGGDEEYTIELNQQGPEGPQGEVGPEGFSPSISVKTNTSAAYILTVTNKEGSFNTPNLYGELEKLNADLSNLPNPAYLNGVILSQNEDGVPSIQLDTSKATVDTDGNLVFSATSSDEEGTETFNYELVLNPSEQRLELHDNEGTVKVVAVTDEIAIVQSQLSDKLDKATYETDKATYATKEELASTDATVANLQISVESNTTSIGSIRESLGNLTNSVVNNATDIARLDSTKLESSNIIAGANIAINRSGNNLTISSTGGGSSGGASIDDGSTSSVTTWSSSKINSEITTVANTKNDNIFDISKFTVVGSPTITDDGVASGFSNARNYIYKDIDIDLSKNIKMQGEFIVGKYSSYPISYGNTWKNGIHLEVGPTGLGIVNFTRDTYIQVKSNIDYNIGDLFGFVITSQNNGLKYSVDFYKNNILVDTNSVTLDTVISPTDKKLIFGKVTTTETASSNATIDLKNFSITVDGEVVFNGLMESTKPIYDKITSTNTALTTFQTDTDNNFSAVNSALNEKANLSDLAGYVPLTKYNELLARVVALETEINGGNA